MGSDSRRAGIVLLTIISIHAPRMGSDRPTNILWTSPIYFNPRSPHGERQSAVSWSSSIPSDFNPRSPHGERRCTRRLDIQQNQYFNPRSPHGERPDCRNYPYQEDPISIHAPRMGSDQKESDAEGTHVISIHAPRMGSDGRLAPYN